MWNLSPPPSPKPPSGFNTGLLLYGACALVALFIGWPYIRDHFPGSFPSERPGNHSGIEPFDAFGWRGDPGRFDRWKTAEQGGRREYSEHFPRDAGRPDAGTYTMHRRGEDGEGDYAAPLPRRPETSGYGSRRPTCWDTVERRAVDPSLCERGRR
jgi:hypothetical protein